MSVPFCRSAECPLLAQSGHSTTGFRCPLLGVKRTLRPSCSRKMRRGGLRASESGQGRGLIRRRTAKPPGLGRLPTALPSSPIRFAVFLVGHPLGIGTENSRQGDPSPIRQFYWSRILSAGRVAPWLRSPRGFSCLNDSSQHSLGQVSYNFT